ncbi:MBL fold metallo-hydrolase [Agromyces sp. ZXT2-6]|uniref:MBL fold metallo-hydrolase n=1 Tax=Agromyces sp. ZXT2-6 TaxID=3461153 RepID=UPI004054A145
MTQSGGPAGRPAQGLTIGRFGEHLHFVRTEHVNWVVYVGPDGVTLVDSGYAGQRELLVSSLAAVGCRPEDVDAVLITHGHADHLGGAARLADEFGTPVFADAAEVPNVRREVTQQAGVGDVLGNVLRPGVLGWAMAIAPLLRLRPDLGVPTAEPFPGEGGRIAVPGRPRRLLVEGHTSGHAAFDFVGEGVLVAGDALVTRHRTSHLVGPQLLPSMFHHDPGRARASLAELSGSSARVLLPGHGEAWIGPVDSAVDAALAAGAAF